MLEKRHGHSTCVMDDTLYAFHGYNGRTYGRGREMQPLPQESIEQMSHASGDQVAKMQWTRIELRGSKSLLDNLLVCPLNRDEFLYLQGKADTICVFNRKSGG